MTVSEAPRRSAVRAASMATLPPPITATTRPRTGALPRSTSPSRPMASISLLPSIAGMLMWLETCAPTATKTTSNPPPFCAATTSSTLWPLFKVIPGRDAIRSTSLRKISRGRR